MRHDNFGLPRLRLNLMALIPLLNDWVIERAHHYGFVPQWRGLRVVAADASTVRFGLRASHVKGAGSVTIFSVKPPRRKFRTQAKPALPDFSTRMQNGIHR